jgi:GNAT superfamily N-acetyltransferase
MLGRMSDVEITTLAARPELVEKFDELDGIWPEFVTHDRIGDALFGLVAEAFPEQCVVATDGGELVAVGRSVPFVFPDEGRTELPDGGWDTVLMWAFADRRQGRTPTVSSALEILIRPSHAGKGLSPLMLRAMRDAVAARGHSTLYAPVRPNGKTDLAMPMTEYAFLTRDDGLPVDPWLRVHVRAGGAIERVATASMVVAGSLRQWREWTGLPFDTDGEVAVPKALVPVLVSQAHDRAVYVEPNVWIRHDLTA